MDPVRFGGDVRLLRRRRGWTQQRLAAEAGVSRWVVVEIEAGRGHRISADRLIRVVAALGGYLSIRIQYRGEGLDRLRDRRHAALGG
jgi:transcriptional regulator with XRE-family HTH domain